MTPEDEAASKARQDAEWQSIVDSYGEAPEFPDLSATEPAEPVIKALEPEPVHVAVPAELASWEDEGHYVPPPPPPVPLPHGARGVAWFGLFGIPTLMLVLLVLHVSLPSYLALLMLVWFVGGFGYLVATMNGPSDPDSGWDDGAVL